MEKEKLESMLIDYIDGRLNEEECASVEREIKENPEAATLYKQLSIVINTMDNTTPLEPSSAMQQKFEEMLQQEIINNNKEKGKQVQLWPVLYKVAAAVLLVIVSGGVGYWIHQRQSRTAEILAIQDELNKVRQLVIEKMENRESPSQRIIAVKTASLTENADTEILDALIKVMNEDPNSNVRLSAIEALAKFHETPKVKRALVASLGLQKEPVVQIALIQLLVKMQEKSALNTLEQISTDDQTLPAVKDEAHIGIFKLS